MVDVCKCGCGDPLPADATITVRRFGYIPGHQRSSGPRPNRRKPPPDPALIPSGICECGCGKTTPLATTRIEKNRWFNGYPKPFYPGHHARVGKGIEVSTVRDLTDIEAAYLAGIVDGEGSITFRTASHRSILVSVGNTSWPLIEWLGNIGGRVRKKTSPSTPAHYKPQWSWVISRRSDVKVLLARIEPFMIIKRDVAQMAIDAIDSTHYESETPYQRH